MLNKVMLIGYLGVDPEVRFTPQGTPVCTFSLATNEKYKKNGEAETRTEWHRIVAFGRLAEICGEYLKKGKLIYIEGNLRTREWEDSKGVKRSTTEIIINSMKILSKDPDDKDENKEFTDREPPELDDIPF